MCWLKPSGMIALRSHEDKNTEIVTQKTLQMKNSFSMEKSKRSKYITNSKLTRSSLFQSINGQHVKHEQRVLRQINMEISSFHQSLSNSVTSSSEIQKLTCQKTFHEKLIEPKQFDLTEP